MVLTKVAHNDAKSLKKIGCIFPHRLGGWGGQTLVWKIPQNFYFSYFVSFPYLKYLHMSWIQTHAKPSIVNTNTDSPTPSTVLC